MRKEYEGIKEDIEGDPLRKQLQRQAWQYGTRDLYGMGREAAITGSQSAASQQVQAMQNALAARGGGNLSSALAQGSQARQPLAQANLQGLITGTGLQQQQIGTLGSTLAAKYAPLLQALGIYTGFQGQIAGAQGRFGAAQIGAANQFMVGSSGGQGVDASGSGMKWLGDQLGIGGGGSSGIG